MKNSGPYWVECLKVLVPVVLSVFLLHDLLYAQTVTVSKQTSGTTVLQDKSVGTSQQPSAESSPPTAVNYREATVAKAPEVQPIQAASSADTPPSAFEEPSKGAQGWLQKVEQLSESIQTGEKTAQDADMLYKELNSSLETKRSELERIIRNRQRVLPDLNKTEPPLQSRAEKMSVDQLQDSGSSKKGGLSTAAAAGVLFKEISLLYDLRIRLLQEITPELRSKITGLEPKGVHELLGEIQQILVELLYQTSISPSPVQRTFAYFRQAPLSAALIALELIFVILIFKLWRSWARKNLERLHRNLLQAESPTRIVRFSAMFMWYLIRIRKPLEWFILVGLFFRITDPTYIQTIDAILWTQIRWFFLAWFCFAFVSAMVKRGTGGLEETKGSLNLRSLRLAIGWLLLLLLLLNFAEGLAGKGTIYEWVWLCFKILAIPLLLLLLSWWRPEVFRMLDKEPTLPPWVERTSHERSGLKSYLGTVIGIVYLILNWLRQQVLRGITSFEGGRVLVASLTQLEAARASEQEEKGKDENPIPATLIKELLLNDDHVIDSIAAQELSILEEYVSAGRSGIAAIISSRGGGKSLLLQRVAMKTDNTSVIFDCPPGGYSAFYRAFTAAIGLEGEDLLPKIIGDRLEESGIRMVGIDNIHRLSRPVFGGLRDLDRVADLINSIEAEVFWILTIDRSAWQYISCIQAQKLFLEEALELPLWNESQIRELIEQRVTRAGVDIDYSRLTLPRQYDDIYFETLEERNQAGYYRILWNVSDGNPVFALRMWVDSLSMTQAGNIVAHIPQPLPTKKLEHLNISGLLVLRAIIQMGMAARRDIIESLKLPEAEVAAAIRFAISNGWIEERYGYYLITWDWYLNIRRVLARQNLMPRRTLGGAL